MKFTITLLLSISWSACFSQDFPTYSLSQTNFNNNGDPLNNIIDPNGAKQGQWTYKNTDDQIVFMQSYENNTPAYSKILVENEWENLNNFIQNTNELLALRSAIISTIGTTQLNGENLITIVKTENGELLISLFGNWNNAEEVKQELNTLITNHTITNKSYVFVQ